MGITLYFNYNPILFYFVAQIILAWATGSSVPIIVHVIGFWVPIIVYISLIVFEYLLTFQHYKMFLIHLVPLFSVLVVDSAISWRSPGSFYGRMVLETKTWALGVLIATWGVISSNPLSWQSKEVYRGCQE